jgi:hypothetical protein
LPYFLPPDLLNEGGPNVAEKTKEPEIEQPKQSVRVGVAGYKTRAETGEKSPKAASAETSTPLFGGTLSIHPPEIPPVASESPEVAWLPAENVTHGRLDPDPAPTVVAEPEKEA